MGGIPINFPLTRVLQDDNYKEERKLSQNHLALLQMCVHYECTVLYKININETALTSIYYDLFSKICQPSPVFLYLVCFHCYICLSSIKIMILKNIHCHLLVKFFTTFEGKG
jgi:hypothetical protein